MADKSSKENSREQDNTGGSELGRGINKTWLVIKYIFSPKCVECYIPCVVLGSIITASLGILALIGIGYIGELLVHLSDKLKFIKCDFSIGFDGWGGCMLCGVFYTVIIFIAIGIITGLIKLSMRCYNRIKELKIYIKELDKIQTNV